MKQDIRKQWVEALRSGKYEQGRTSLRNLDNTFCCLGVLCDLIFPNDWVKRESHNDYTIHREAAILPQSVINATGLDDMKGLFINEDGDSCTLTELNDVGLTFSEIADIIEKHF